MNKLVSEAIYNYNLDFTILYLVCFLVMFYVSKSVIKTLISMNKEEKEVKEEDKITMKEGITI